jgi:hypothetical protein
MRRLPSLIVLLILSVSLFAQSPHGDELKISCADCHNPNGWKMVEGTYTFTHNSTDFPLVGQHQTVNCKACHKDLNFSKAQSDCISCHTDVHEQTVGNECSRCHTPQSWQVPNTTQLHEQSRFPLLGAHATADCFQCHESASLLRFDPLGIDCYDCHQADYLGATDPVHDGGFSTDCVECHAMNSFAWKGAGISHLFFPLTQGHETNDCFACHEEGQPYNSISAECVSCHISDYNATTNPNHQTTGFSTDCAECHTTSPDWKPAEMRDHDAQYFPIYSGKHGGEWDNCNDCHTTPGNYSLFSCTDCHDHNQSDSDNQHDGVGGYVYNSNACFECHPQGTSEDSFNHSLSNFPLTGAHITTECLQCHETGYVGTTTVCVDCHITDFNQSTNPNHAALGLSNSCETCHTTAPDWTPATMDNHNDFYILDGAHLPIAPDCNICHEGNYADSPNTCFGCHSDNYNQTTNPNHQQIGITTECEVCHTTMPDWKPATFDIHNDYYALNGAHNTIANDCFTCHEGNYTNTPNLCFGCHADNYNQTTNPPHAASQFSTECETCHTESAWSPSTFDHDSQYFPIYSGKHNGQWADCNECHTTPNNFALFSCIDCHEHNQVDTDNSHNGVGGYSYNSIACFECHPTGEGQGFDHNLSNFPLTGAHLITECLACHESGFSGTTTICSDCHITDYNQSVNPNHQQAGIPITCETCHTTAPGWAPATYPIHNDVYPLTGAHATIQSDCFTCHEGNYTNTPNLCSGCHTTDFNEAINPNHQQAGIPTTCETCHTTTPGWAPATYPIHNDAYPLTGAHATIQSDCFTCHAGNYTNTPNTCAGCHTTDFNQSTNPNHQQTGIPTTCETCHTTAPGWAPATFPIHNDYYDLNGAHTTIDCFSCHEGNYTSTPNLCFGCHTDDYNQTTNPNHFEAQFPTTCESCHTETAWSPSTFDHDGQYFPIYSGSHAGEWTNCNECHTTPGNYTEFNCIICHTQTETNGQHQGVSGYTWNSQACFACHPNGEGDGFNHNATDFPLTGAHTSVACIECHADGYIGTSTVCSSCHTDAYNQAVNPNHQQNNFPTTCETCHTTTAGWSPATFPIHNDYYALTGAHQTISADCFACHEGNYTNTPNTCAGCHTDNYNQATNPNHVSLDLPTNCDMCHTTNPDWDPATFPIHNDYYVLAGAHLSIANNCAVCHNGNYISTPNTCYGCHQDNYNQSTDPDHQAAQFPTSCEDCHTQTAWTPSTFDHDDQYFPIYSGSHQGQWNTCAECHTNPNDYTVFSCTICHTQSESNSDHQGVSGYIWNSDACYACHPNGEGDGFNHSTTDFPLTGAHSAVACIECHEDGYVGTSTVCSSCHTDAYNQAVNPNHQQNNFPTTCETCHTTATGWSPATFPIHNDYYVLAGAHVAIANNCAECHNGNYINTPNTCFGCHQTEYNQTNNPDHQAAQFPTTCLDCHTQSAWTPSTFEHDAQYFPIYSGSHQGQWNSCAECHTNPNDYTVFSCTICHTQSESNSDHQGVSGYTWNSDACFACHPNGEGDGFNHSTTDFPLTGAHAAVACVECHADGYTGTSTVCSSCHNDAYNQAVNPNHQQNNFPTTCETCHTTATGWTPATFPIHNDYYALTGAHQTISADCFACHEGNYTNTPNTCAGCHTDNYNQATNPNHVSLSLPTNCDLCHSTSPDWDPATFPIHNEYYVLAGAHISIANDCAQCHNGNYNSTPNTCYGCHQSEYNQTNDPDHQAAQFPTSCEDCHTQSTWNPSTFDHDNQYFPIYSGQHNNEWNTCSECHPNASDYTIFTCLTCHSQGETNGDHNGVSGYQYNSNACLTCHPDGNGDKKIQQIIKREN